MGILVIEMGFGALLEAKRTEKSYICKNVYREQLQLNMIMRKTNLLAVMSALLVLMCPMPADAQSNWKNKLKNLGRSVVGAVTGNEADRQVGQTVQVGEITMSAHGSNPGMNFDYAGCRRVGNDVQVLFVLTNASQSTFNNLWMRNYDTNATWATDTLGRKYTKMQINLGGLQSSEGVSTSLASGKKMQCSVTLRNVPASIKRLAEVRLNFSTSKGMNAEQYPFSFRLKNVPIAEAVTDAAVRLTTKGWGTLNFAQSYKNFPKQISGLYDKLVINENLEADIPEIWVEFYRGGKLLMTGYAYDDGSNGRLSHLELFSADVITQDGITANMPMKQVLANGGKYADHDMWGEGCWVGNTFVMFDVSKLTQAARTRCRNAARAGNTCALKAADVQATNATSVIFVLKKF